MTKERPEIETKRLFLRSFELSDGPRIKELAGDKAIADKTISIPLPYENGMAEKWIATHLPGFEAGELVECAIVLNSIQKLIGAIGLSINKSFNRAELGYWIGKEYWNQGFCTEAAEAIVEYSFHKLELNKVTSNHFTRNPSSGRVMKKIGMQKEGIHREHLLKWGKYEDIVSYAILKKEWEMRR